MNLREAIVCIFGTTRSGKSELARELFIRQGAPRAVIDVKSEQHARLPGVPVIDSPSELTRYPTCVLVPPDPSNEGWYDEVYTLAFRHGDYLLWLDEANEVTSRSYIPRAMRTFVLQGLGRGCGHYSLSPRPADVHKTFESQAGHLFYFKMYDARDRDAVIQQTGIPRPEVDRAFDELGPYEFLHYERGIHELVAFDALPHPDGLTSRISRMAFGPPT